MANPNIVNVSSILGTTGVVSSLGTAATTIIASVTASHVFKLNSITVANKTATACYVTIYVTRSAVNYHLAYQITIPANATLSLLGKDMGIYLQESDVLTGLSQTATALDVLASYEDIS
jgi:hypothetical protein